MQRIRMILDPEGGRGLVLSSFSSDKVLSLCPHIACCCPFRGTSVVPSPCLAPRSCFKGPPVLLQGPPGPAPKAPRSRLVACTAGNTQSLDLDLNGQQAWQPAAAAQAASSGVATAVSLFVQVRHRPTITPPPGGQGGVPGGFEGGRGGGQLLLPYHRLLGCQASGCVAGVVARSVDPPVRCLGACDIISPMTLLPTAMRRAVRAGRRGPGPRVAVHRLAACMPTCGVCSLPAQEGVAQGRGWLSAASLPACPPVACAPSLAPQEGVAKSRGRLSTASLPAWALSSEAMIFLNIPMDAETPSMRLLRPQALVQEEAIRWGAGGGREGQGGGGGGQAKRPQPTPPVAPLLTASPPPSPVQALGAHPGLPHGPGPRPQQRPGPGGGRAAALHGRPGAAAGARGTQADGHRLAGWGGSLRESQGAAGRKLGGSSRWWQVPG